MAFCPKCKGEIAAYEAKCPKCGYDFPLSAEPDGRTGLAYSTFADVCLVIGSGLAALSAVVSLVRGGIQLIDGHIYSGLVECPLFALGSFIVFIALEKLRRL